MRQVCLTTPPILKDRNGKLRLPNTHTQYPSNPLRHNIRLLHRLLLSKLLRNSILHMPSRLYRIIPRHNILRSSTSNSINLRTTLHRCHRKRSSKISPFPVVRPLIPCPRLFPRRSCPTNLTRSHPCTLPNINSITRRCRLLCPPLLITQLRVNTHTLRLRKPSNSRINSLRCIIEMILGGVTR